MRFMLLLLVAMAATITWQTNALAGLFDEAKPPAVAAGEPAGDKKPGDQEPECE